MFLPARRLDAWNRDAKRAAGALDADRLTFPFGPHAELRGDLVGEIAEVDGLRRQLRPADFGPRQGEQAVDQAAKPIDLLEHAADNRPVGVGVAPLAQADFAD